MCRKYLGLKDTVTWCQNADEALCDALMERLLSSGNFGQKEGVDRLETAVSMMRRELTDTTPPAMRMMVRTETRGRILTAFDAHGRVSAATPMDGLVSAQERDATAFAPTAGA